MAEPHIRILMGTCRGARYLQDQLDSFLIQTHRNWSLWVSDDGSDDATRDILERFARHHPGRDIRLFTGPEQGISANYLSLLWHPALSEGLSQDLSQDLPETLSEPGGFVALSDQDDVWRPDRLSAALAHLRAAGPAGPRLYAAPTVLTDARLQPGRARRPRRADTGFPNALVQNVLAGHTMALCPAALRLVRQARPGAAVPFHDWWLYLLITGAGGRVLCDHTPRVLYRQHGQNALGASHGGGAALRRARAVLDGTYGAWVAANLSALHRVQDHLTPVSRDQLAAFDRARGGLARLRQLRRAGIRRTDPLGQMALSALTLTGRL